MLLIPYKADVDLGRWPVMTLIVCAICIWVFTRQAWSAHQYEESLSRYCNHNVTRDEQLVLRYVATDADQHYCDVLLDIRSAADSKAAIRALADEAKQIPFYRDRADSSAYISSVLSQSFTQFDRAVPRNLTDQLHYDPQHPTIKNMVTAAFSHGSWWHLISNLIFFLAFAASVEVITGYLYYGGFILAAAIGTHAAYWYSVQGVEGALPTVGLSGVVMAMMAFIATVAPALSIRCFFWFLIFIRIFRVPALAIAGLYIVENIFDYVNRDANDTVNYVAHLSGAVVGVALGIVYRLRHREYVSDLLSGI